MIASPSQTPSNHPEPTTGPTPTSEPSLPLFRPTGSKLEQLLSDLLKSYGSLHDVALNNDTTLAALTLWMAMPENQALLDQVESAGYRRARLTASNVLADAVNSLSCSLRGHVEIETKHYAQLDYAKIRIYERARTNARKAAWLLYRISRSHPALPIDPATRLKLEVARTERARLKAELKADSNAQHTATPNAQHTGTPSFQPAATTHAAQPPLQFPPQSIEQSPPQSIPPSNTASDSDRGPLSTPPSPSPSPSSETPSLPPTGSVPPPLSLRHSVTPSLPSVALRDLRGESASSSPPEPPDEIHTALESGATEDTKDSQLIHENHDAALLPCGIPLDSS